MALNFSNDIGLAGIQQGVTANRPQSPTIGLLYYNIDLGYFESYTINGWFPIAASPTSPTSVVATNQGSARAYNNGQASVAFTPNTSGGPASSFIVRPTPSTSPATFSGASSPVIVTNLASSTQYTYTVIASSPYGNSSESVGSSSVTATTVPQAPTIGTVTAGNALATVEYTAGATGGSSVTSYTATSSPGGLTGTGSSPITVSGLTNGTAYTFTVTATNANGTSSASSASSSVTPVDVRYNLVSWYDFNSFANASTLADLSGNGYTLTKNSGSMSSRSFNGKTGWGFSGVPNTWGFTISKAFNLTEMTIIYVGYNSGPNNGKNAITIASTSPSDSLQVTMEGGGGGDNKPISYGNGAYAPSTSGSGSEALYSHSLPSSSSSFTVPINRVNGTNVTDAGSATAATITATHTVGKMISIDDYNGTGAGYWWEIKVFDKALTESEMATEEAYFRTKWGL